MYKTGSVSEARVEIDPGAQDDRDMQRLGKAQQFKVCHSLMLLECTDRIEEFSILFDFGVHHHVDGNLGVDLTVCVPDVNGVNPFDLMGLSQNEYIWAD